MNIIIFNFISVLLFSYSPKICESAEGREEPLDFRNPIDLQDTDNRQSQSHSEDIFPLDGNPTLVLYDDRRDEARRKEGVDDRRGARQPKRVVFRDDSFDHILDRNRNIHYHNYYIDAERQREIDRRNHLRINLRSAPGNPGNFLNSRIQEEREDEIRREVSKALDRKEKFLEDITLNKRRGWDPNTQRLLDQRNHLPSDSFAKRIGTFDSSFERSEMERRNRLSLIEKEKKTIKRNTRRPNRGFIRKRLTGQREDFINRRREEEKLKSIENRRTSEILNEKIDAISSNAGLMKRPYENKLKPPILIYEEVRVPVKIYDDYHSNEFDKKKNYDNRPSNHVDRRPGRPNTDEVLNDGTYVEEEGVLLEDLPGVLPVSISSAPIGTVDPAFDANIALTTNFVTAVELERFNQAAAIADINALQQLQLQQAAALATINEINQATLNKHLQDASILANANAVEEAAHIAAINDQNAAHLATNQDNILSQALINKNYVDTASSDEQLLKAQKVDFMNLVLKHGLKQALKEQLKIHLNSKVEEDAFIHSLQVTRDDLIRRLIMLKPYFLSPNTRGFILPDFIPNIPNGFDYANHDDLENLPQIHLLPTTTLLAPDFRIPEEISVGLKRDVDITFVEHVLRLPEHVFKKVIHLPKKEFILTLFPTLYRETVRDFKYNPVKHYHPNLPHKGIVKEHHHHHHIYTPPSVEKDQIFEHPNPQFKGGYPNYETPKEEHHIHQIPQVQIFEHPNPPFEEGYPKYIIPKDEHHVHHISPSPPKPPHHTPRPQTVQSHNIPFEHVVAQLLPDSHEEVHVVRHPAHLIRPHLPRPPLTGHFDHPRLTIPHGGVSFEEPPSTFVKSSYIAYQGQKPKFAAGPATFHPREPAFPQLISPHPLKGINIRHKGEKKQSIIPSHSTRISTKIFDDPLESRNGDIKITNSQENFRLQQITRNKFQNTIPLTEEDNNIKTSTSLSLELEEINPSTINPKSISVTDGSNELGTSTLPSHQVSTFTNLPIHVTTISSLDVLNALDALSLNPAISTSNSVPDDRDKEDQASKFFSEIEPSLSESSTSFPSSNTFAPVHTPFQGFSGNIRQMTFAERLKQSSEAESNFNNIPGSDANDDEHVPSFFQKKKGNATSTTQANNNILTSKGGFKQTNSAEEIVGKVKRITNIFGTRLQETIPEIHVKKTNESSSPFNPFFPGSPSNLDDIIKPSSQIGISSDFIRPISRQNQFRLSIKPQVVEDNQEINNAIFAKFADDIDSKRPMPRKIDFATQIFDPDFHSQRRHFPHKGSRRNAPVTPESHGHDITPKTFRGIQVNGLENLPHHLRTAPPCSWTSNSNRSFCIYPQNYDSKIADEIIHRYSKEIEELKIIMKQIPIFGPDLTEASKQLPHLNLSAKCEVEERGVKLSWSRDILGSWLSILQTEPFEQTTLVSTCSDSARKNGCRPLLQPRPFIAFHPSDVIPKPYIMEFPLPVACVYAKL